MHCPSDYFILKVASQVIKVIAVAGHTYNQIPVFLRMFLGIAQGVGIYYVKLDMMAVHPKVAPDQVSQLNSIIPATEKLRRKFLIEQGAPRLQMVDFGC